MRVAPSIASARAALLFALTLASVDVAHAADPPSSRFRLESSTLDPPPEGKGRFSIQGRLAPEAKAGELRESSRFTIIGRIAGPVVKANCGDDTIFSNGFEGP